MNIPVKKISIVILQYIENHGLHSANREGLLSLANHLFNLVQDDVPCATHIHLDECNALKTVR